MPSNRLLEEGVAVGTRFTWFVILLLGLRVMIEGGENERTYIMKMKLIATLNAKANDK